MVSEKIQRKNYAFCKLLLKLKHIQVQCAYLHVNIMSFFFFMLVAKPPQATGSFVDCLVSISVAFCIHCTQTYFLNFINRNIKLLQKCRI